MEDIETSIVKGLLYNDTYAHKVYPFLQDEFFEGSHLTIFQTYKGLYEKYSKVPTLEALIHSVKKIELNESEFESNISILKYCFEEKDEPVDIQWLMDETEEYCTNKATFNAIYKSINIIEGNEKGMTRHSIPDILEDALSISFNTEVGSSYLDNALERYQYYINTERKLEMPLKALNKLMNGGLPPKTLSAVLAFSNVGKSALMAFLAGELIKQGKNVLYITLEMSEEQVQQRIDANLLDVTTDELDDKNLSQEWFMSKIQKMKEKGYGQLFVKEYPTSSASSAHFKSLLKELQMKKKFKPDIVFIDYINICASSRYTSLTGVNSYSYIKAIAEELRALAVEFELPIFTATQINREGGNSNSPDMTHTSESIGLPQTLDWFGAITTNDLLMEENKQLFHLLKTRFGNKKSAKTIPVGIDFDKMRYYDIDMDGDSPANHVNTRKPDTHTAVPNIMDSIPKDSNWNFE